MSKSMKRYAVLLRGTFDPKRDVTEYPVPPAAFDPAPFALRLLGSRSMRTLSAVADALCDPDPAVRLARLAAVERLLPPGHRGFRDLTRLVAERVQAGDYDPRMKET